MRQGFVFSLCVMLTVCASVWGVGGNMGGADPNGSPEKPYLIEDLADFDTFANPTNAATYWAAGVHTKLMTDIDLAGRTYTTAVIAPDTNSASYGFQGTKFAGVFDGSNYSISNLSITLTDCSYVGFFGYIDSSAQIINLNLNNSIFDITGDDYIGGLVGYIYQGTIDSCSVNGVLNVESGYAVGGLIGYNFEGSVINSNSNIELVGGRSYFGGLVGENSNGTMNSCHSTGQIIAMDAFYIGGLIGNNEGFVTNCSSSCDVSGQDYVGGLVGYNRNGTILFSSATGDISGTECVGGLAGYNADSDILDSFAMGCVHGQVEVGGLAAWTTGGNITNCYSNGNVSGSQYVGGLTGGINSDGNITFCYSSGKVDGEEYVGGFLGMNTFNEGVLTQCFWDVESSETTIAYIVKTGSWPDYVYTTIYSTTGIAESKTTAEMKMLSTFTAAGWDFSTPVWMMLRELEDYPRLAWQEIYMGDIAGLYGADMVDFAYLANYWGLTGCNSGTDCGRADIDGSGDVGLGDLVYVAQDWLK
ncbi:MAG: GLUG motif-containing protein [Planctomycetota bacterium]|jgi:hypothetical protein